MNETNQDSESSLKSFSRKELLHTVVDRFRRLSPFIHPPIELIGKPSELENYYDRRGISSGLFFLIVGILIDGGGYIKQHFFNDSKKNMQHLAASEVAVSTEHIYEKSQK